MDYAAKQKEWNEMIEECKKMLNDMHENNQKMQNDIDDMNAILNNLRERRMIREKHYREYWSKS